MDKVDKLYAWLAAQPAPEPERVFAAALGQAESPYRERIIAFLQERGTDAALAGLVANFHLLPLEVRDAMLVDPQRFRTAVGIALADRNGPARRGALAVLREHPCPALAYALPEMLRDSSEEIRRCAAEVLRITALHVLEAEGELEEDLPEDGARHAERLAVATAVREALRSFDLHYRTELVEIGLWFADELGDLLWQILSSRRSPCARIVADNLRRWDSPRLAPFLLRGLTQPGWLATVQQVLRSWRTPEHLAALLRHTHLLGDPEIRRRVRLLKGVPWFDEVDERLATIPPRLRALVPQWLLCLNCAEPAMIDVLQRWINAEDQRLQRGALYALAELQSPAALHRLREIAERRDPLGNVAGALADEVQAGLASQRCNAALPRAERRQLAPARFEQLWIKCRQRAARDDTDLLVTIRDNLSHWRPLVLAQFQSRDAGDRLLALRIVAGSPNAAAFRNDLVPLLNDPVDAIRRLAYRIYSAIVPPQPAFDLSVPRDASCEARQKLGPKTDPAGLRHNAGRDPQPAIGPRLKEDEV